MSFEWVFECRRHAAQLMQHVASATMWQSVTFVCLVCRPNNCSQINFTFRICFVSIFRPAMKMASWPNLLHIANVSFWLQGQVLFLDSFPWPSVAAVRGCSTVAHSLHSSPWLISSRKIENGKWHVPWVSFYTLFIKVRIFLFTCQILNFPCLCLSSSCVLFTLHLCCCNF